MEHDQAARRRDPGLKVTLRGQLWTGRKPGYKPPLALLQRLRRLHPRVRLVWSTQFGQWGLIEKTLAGPWEFIVALQGTPTLANTINLLNRCSFARLADPEQMEAYIAELDQKQEAAQAVTTDERLLEGADRMYNMVRSGHVVAMEPPRGRAHGPDQRPKTRRARKA